MFRLAVLVWSIAYFTPDTLDKFAVGQLDLDLIGLVDLTKNRQLGSAPQNRKTILSVGLMKRHENKPVPASGAIHKGEVWTLIIVRNIVQSSGNSNPLADVGFDQFLCLYRSVLIEQAH